MTFFASKELAHERYEICKSCEHLVDLTKQCNQCWCWLPAKVRKYSTRCPIGKWESGTGASFEHAADSTEIPPLGDYKYKNKGDQSA
jgi:hypothetical protein